MEKDLTLKPDVEEYNELLQEKNADKLLDLEVIDKQLTSNQAKRYEMYKRIYSFYVQTGNIAEVARQNNLSRGTVYNALKFFRETNLVVDQKINQTVALDRVRRRILRLENILKHEEREDAPLPAAPIRRNHKYIAFLYQEIRKSEHQEHQLLNILNPDDKKDSGKKITILQNIRGNVQNNVSGPERLHSPADAEVIPRQSS